MKKCQWKWIFTESKTCCIIWRPFWFAMTAILNPKWSPEDKNPLIWEKFGFQVDYDVANWYPLFGSHVMILQIISYHILFSLYFFIFLNFNFNFIIQNYDFLYCAGTIFSGGKCLDALVSVNLVRDRVLCS